MAEACLERSLSVRMLGDAGPATSSVAPDVTINHAIRRVVDPHRFIVLM